MNVFVLDHDPRVAARAHCDKHVVKMPLETAQILSTALHLNGLHDSSLYAPTHARHPCVLWAAASRANFEWLAALGLELVREHGLRYAHTRSGREGHRSRPIIERALRLANHVPDGARTPFVQAMPDEYRRPDAVEAYRAYYRGDKRRFATWRAPRSIPRWFAASPSPDTPLSSFSLADEDCVDEDGHPDPVSWSHAAPTLPAEDAAEERARVVQFESVI